MSDYDIWGNKEPHSDDRHDWLRGQGVGVRAMPRSAEFNGGRVGSIDDETLAGTITSLRRGVQNSVSDVAAKGLDTDERKERLGGNYAVTRGALRHFEAEATRRGHDLSDKKRFGPSVSHLLGD